jgi:hypothetical protein
VLCHRPSYDTAMACCLLSTPAGGLELGCKRGRGRVPTLDKGPITPQHFFNQVHRMTSARHAAARSVYPSQVDVNFAGSVGQEVFLVSRHSCII